MTLRTPRRRISPRTKHRYRVIRNFFRKALGTTSQSEIKIGSSIAINVTDLKHKIIGLENQLSEVSKHCQELVSLESFSKNSNSIVPIEQLKEPETDTVQAAQLSEHKLCAGKTQILYKAPENNFKRLDKNDTLSKLHDYSNGDQRYAFNIEYQNTNDPTHTKKKSKVYGYAQNLHKRKTNPVYENLSSVYSACSFHTIEEQRMAHSPTVNDGYINPLSYRQHRGQNVDVTSHKNKAVKDLTKMNTNETKPRKTKRNRRQLDQDFIADIIRRQYKPMKMFGKRESDISQFSAPVCRDQEYSIKEDIQQNSELCSCCYDMPNKSKSKKRQDLNEMRSLCDARLYNAKKHPRPKHRRKHFEAYNDSDLYDIIPVKENSSPKSRKKSVGDTMVNYNYYREVPPSPRTLRPRLNLKAQYYAEFEDFLTRKHLKRKSPNKLKRSLERGEGFECEESYEEDDDNISQEKNYRERKVQKQPQALQENVTMSSVQEQNNANLRNTTVDAAFNKALETELSTDRTDKALCEIKDILQIFLQEIKKEVSQCDKSDITIKAAATAMSDHEQKTTANVMPNSGHSFNNYTAAHCGLTSFVPPFTNPCCYPILPVCPMNYMQNGYIVPNPSVACATCSSKKDIDKEKPTSNNNNVEGLCSPETEQLIKEIYKYVARSPRENNAREFPKADKDAKLLTSKRTGGSTKMSKHDAKVGTPTTRCYSKSCEAIGSRIISDAYCSTTNQTYSDTILEKLSLEPTPSDSISEADFTTDTTSGDKSKKNRFAKVLQSFGIKKKKKINIIEELSESESAANVEVRNRAPQFSQDATNYMIHGREYYHPPPVPPMHAYQERPHEYQDYRAPYPCGIDHRPVHEIYHPHTTYQHSIHEHRDPRYPPTPIPTAPPYSHSFDSYSPTPQNVPLCLKEIEVKSIGTQSERRMSFFEKIKTKIQLPVQTGRYDENPQKTNSTQTVENKPGLFNWKGMENKSKKNVDPLTFSYFKQKQLAEGDTKMRDVMLKKLFQKRNPFSPRNIFVKTLLGKDRSSFGQPPMTLRPRMFL